MICTNYSGCKKGKAFVLISFLLFLICSISAQATVRGKAIEPVQMSYDQIYQRIITTWESLEERSAYTENSLIDTLFVDQKQTVHAFSIPMIRQEDISPKEAQFVTTIVSFLENVKTVWKPTTRAVPLYSDASDELFDVLYENADKNNSLPKIPIKCYSNQSGDMTISEYPELTIDNDRAVVIQNQLRKTHGYTITHLKLIGSGWFIVSFKETAEKAKERAQRANDTKKAFLDAYYNIMTSSENAQFIVFNRPYSKVTIKQFFEKRSEYAPQSVFSGYPSRLFFCFGVPEFNNYDYSLQDISAFLQSNLSQIVNRALNGFVTHNSSSVLYSK